MPTNRFPLRIPRRTRVSHDPLLDILTDLANIPDVEVGVPITLQCPGIFACGRTCSAKRYLEELGKTLAKGFPNEFADTGEIISSNFTNLAAESTGKRAAHGYIHLSSVRFFSPGGGPLPSSRGEPTAFWRARLSEITAFFLGEFEAH